MKPLPEKIYYRINEVATAFEVNPSLLRYWIKEFSFFIKPKKNSKGENLLTSKDIENLKIIYYLVKEKSYTLEGAKKQIKKNRQKINKNINVINRLKNIREELIKIKNNL